MIPGTNIGITPTGFIRPNIDILESDIHDKYSTRFDDGGLNPISLEPESFFGDISSIDASMYDEAMQLLESEYYAKFLITATGADLDRAAIPGVRFPAIQAIGQVTLTGTAAAVIPAGSIFETELNIQFTLNANVTLSGGGTGTGNITAIIGGTPGNVSAGTIKFIPVPISGLDSVTNANPTSGGTAIESDNDFRTRILSSRSLHKTSTLDDIIAAVRLVTNVNYATGYEFFVAGTQGQPPGSVQIVVGGTMTNNDVAAAIGASRASGVSTFGSQSGVYTNLEGQPKTIYFDLISQINLYCTINVTVQTGIYNAASDNDIKDLILQYIGGTNPSSVNYPGVTIGEIVYAWKCQATLFELSNTSKIPGLAGVTITLGAGAPGALTQYNSTPTQKPIADYAFMTINKTFI